MNFVSANPTALFSAPLSAGTPLAGNSQALARLTGFGPLGGPSALQGLMQQVLHLEHELLDTLRNLMVGLPGIGSLPGIDPVGGNSQGGHIPGGKSNYAHGMFHKGVKGAPDTYAFENSPAGIKFAAEHGYSSIDLDMQITKDGVPVNTHWAQPMLKDGFYDPEHKLSPNTKISDMTLAEVSRLRNKDGQSVIHTMASQIAELKKYGIAGDLEAKDDPRFATAKVMGELAGLVRGAGIKANLKSIDRGERSTQILKAAQAQGFWVRTAEGGGKAARDFGYGN